MEARESANIQEVLDQDLNTWKTESVWLSSRIELEEIILRTHSPLAPLWFFQEQLAERLLNCWENMDKVTIKYLPCISEIVLGVHGGVGSVS